MDYSKLTHIELVNLLIQKDVQIESLKCDPFTGFMNASGAYTYHPRIPSGKILMMVDMCNVHAMNHRFGQAEVNQRWINSFVDMRLGDIVIKHGGDEFVIILDSNDYIGFFERLDQRMQENDVYAVFGVVTTSNDLRESVNRADKLVNAKKLELENAGMKPNRDQSYICLQSHVVVE